MASVARTKGKRTTAQTQSKRPSPKIPRRHSPPTNVSFSFSFECPCTRLVYLRRPPPPPPRLPPRLPPPMLELPREPLAFAALPLLEEPPKAPEFLPPEPPEVCRLPTRSPPPPAPPR